MPEIGKTADMESPFVISWGPGGPEEKEGWLLSVSFQGDESLKIDYG